MFDDDSSFLRVILDDPSDDALHLVYCDWLEERGRSEDLAQSEFIRCQLKLASHEAAAATRGTAFPASPMPEGFLCSRIVEELRRRERDLLEAHAYPLGGTVA